QPRDHSGPLGLPDAATGRHITTGRTKLDAALVARRTEAGTLYGQRQISGDSFVAADREITASLKSARSRLRYAEQMANFSLGNAKDLVRWWNTAPTASKKAIAILLLERVEVFPASARGVRTVEPGRVVLHWRKLSNLSGG
ncbi:hypothetical protein ACFYRY_42815, partial [Streptomyces sp. NPDC005263]|uniref:hypothetical protein n=1 Tax=Streptomyces sp. NPDC005263 TaxID=3364711 RepID=UPI00368A3F62